METYAWIREDHELRAMDGDTVAGRILFPEASPGRWTITSTFVDPAYRGRGLASELVQRVMDMAAVEDIALDATCSYAVKWLERHADA